MLKNIDPLLTPELLKVLAEMGHGDEIAVVDANFTAASLAAAHGRVLRLAGAGLVAACDAVLSLLPLDSGDASPAAFMQHAGMPEGQPSALQARVIDSLVRVGGVPARSCQAMERFAFYERVRRAWAVVQTSEPQPFGNFLFKKGVILAQPA
ncbi:MAG: RbsD or FucU transport [Betaproteobacteria bacterium]|nr:RbsD or FucU transport [Betaproteobacteria bacterium]MBU6512158.1 RbsD or FucU transport [Betaproteobacteria bacterium]MDE1954517.1 RbsD or FucU transport [Betaproteobacteria bacterium]MDE2151896.1 RbsD or FucU transport [Betaproteobacteria bacterium]MDE2478420.1 RbsD or FucU transport [Betaproteobacteria bacterium]